MELYCIFLCGQPAQQHGLRIPPFSLESDFSIRIFLVSAFLPEMTQQIHSLRASGVISFQIALAEEALMAFRKSSGTLCIVPIMFFLTINLSKELSSLPASFIY